MRKSVNRANVEVRSNTGDWLIKKALEAKGKDVSDILDLFDPPERQPLTNRQIATALIQAEGYVTVAAQILGVGPTAIHNRTAKHPPLRNLIRLIEEQRLDYAEDRLTDHIKDGQIAANIFYLKTKGKQRGYSERQELTGKDGKPLGWNITQDLEQEILSRLKDEKKEVKGQQEELGEGVIGLKPTATPDATADAVDKSDNIDAKSKLTIAAPQTKVTNKTEKWTPPSTMPGLVLRH